MLGETAGVFTPIVWCCANSLTAEPGFESSDWQSSSVRVDEAGESEEDSEEDEEVKGDSEEGEDEEEKGDSEEGEDEGEEEADGEEDEDEEEGGRDERRLSPAQSYIGRSQGHLWL